MKRSHNSKKIIIAISILFLVAVLLFIAWMKGVFYIIEKQKSPNGEITTTVYNRDISDTFPKNTGFTIKDSGSSKRTKIYSDGYTFEDLWWSPCSEYMIVSTICDEERYLELKHYTKNSVANLNVYLNMSMSGYEEFTTLMTKTENWETLKFIFLNWVDEKATMKVKFTFTDYNNNQNEGTFHYNCETGNICNILFEN